MRLKLKSIVQFIALFFMLTLNTNAGVYYVSLTGDDINNPGTIDLPFKTITRAITAAVAGDTIYVRGGTYVYSTSLSISKSGTSTNRFYLFAYPGERPLLDFSLTALGTRGIKLSANYWHIKGFDVKGAGDNGMNISKSYNIIEFCSFFENKDSGLQIGGGGSNNQIINCDSYFNVDPGQGNADGFSPKLDVGTGNYFYGCRSWQNSDDGWDGYLRPRPSIEITTTLENCWCFMNGYLKSGTVSVGNGNGFKMGGSDSANLEHNFILKNCVAFDNRVKGFDQNNNRGSMTLYNCTGYRNLSKNYSISGPIDSGKTLTVINCVALGSYGSLGSYAVQHTNSWMAPFVVDNSDFVSIDTTGVRGPRNADGSLPDITFLHLAPGSDLIDAGTNIGLPFNGSAPDLGAFETKVPDDVIESEDLPSAFRLYQNYPNPFNPSTKLSFSLANNGLTMLKVYNILGKEVVTLFASNAEAGKLYELTFDAAKLSNGLYFYKLQNGRNVEVKKMILIK